MSLRCLHITGNITTSGREITSAIVRVTNREINAHVFLFILFFFRKKYATLHEFVCYPCTWGHGNLLSIVPILVNVLLEQTQI